MNAPRASTTPRVSVLLPVRDGERFLAAAIESILRQTCPNFELLVIDNGSADASHAIADSFAARDGRVRVVSVASPGQALALNEGLRLARARLIARMDADDIAAPRRFERQLAVLDARPDVAALGTHGWLIGATGAVVGQSRVGPTTEQEFARLRRAGELVYLLHPSVMFRADVVARLGGYQQQYAPAEDVELWSRIADDCLVLTLPEPLLRYRVHDASMSTSRFHEQMEQLRRARLNMRRRRAGVRELTRAEFALLEADEPTWRTARRRLQLRSHACYRRAGGQIAAGHARGFAWLALSALTYPPLPVARLARQRVIVTLARSGRRR